MKIIKTKHNLYLLLIVVSLFTSSCNGQKKESKTKNKTEDVVTDTGKHILSAPIVHKSFILKNGVASDYTEMYIQRSSQDYFIKFCESKISRKELEKELSKIDGDIKTATLEVEFQDGSWDVCDENFMQQSRVGAYVTIHRIINN